MTMSIFAAVRMEQSTRAEWIDVDTVSLHMTAAEVKAHMADKAMPDWSGRNPVQRIAQFRLSEIN